MKFIEPIKKWWRGILRKRRLSMHSATDHSEEWHMHISPASIFAAFISFVLIIFIVVLSLVAYTPVLEFLPGYSTEADKARENLIHNIIRIDSMERMMGDMLTYNQNIALVMEGKTPVARLLAITDSSRTDKTIVPPSHIDSLLRAQMEGAGAYSLTDQGAAARGAVRQSIELVRPVEGIITERFDIGASRFGVRIATVANDRVAAIDNGTVIQSIWTPETGHIVMIQHGQNLVSVYRNLSRSLVSAGQTVRAAEPIGYTADKTADKVQLFELELWNNGKPVDPEAYIVF